jgi:hypothetical protein
MQHSVAPVSTSAHNLVSASSGLCAKVAGSNAESKPISTNNVGPTTVRFVEPGFAKHHVHIREFDISLLGWI